MVGCSAAVVILCFSSRLQPGDKRAVCSSHWVPAVPCMVPHSYWDGSCSGAALAQCPWREGQETVQLGCLGPPHPASGAGAEGAAAEGLGLLPWNSSLSLGTCSSGLLGTLWQLGTVCAVPSPESRCHSCLGAFAGSQQGVAPAALVWDPRLLLRVPLAVLRIAPTGSCFSKG